MNADIASFLRDASWEGAELQPLAGDASARVYWRLQRDGKASAILMQAPVAEVVAFDAFQRIARWLRDRHLSAPEILAADRSKGLMLLEDFGDGLVARLADDRPARIAELYASAVDVLSDLAGAVPPDGLTHLNGQKMVEMWEPTFAALSDRTLANELSTRSRDELAAEFEVQLAGPTAIALRDYHAGNLFHLPDRQGLARTGLIDFQDAVLAPIGYDLASLVDDVRRVVPMDLRTALIARHAAALGLAEGDLARRVDALSLQRNFRILGVLSALGQKPNGAQYLQYLPRTAALLRRAVTRPDLAPFAALIDAVLPALGLEDVEAAE